jgi:hypothetical protein
MKAMRRTMEELYPILEVRWPGEPAPFWFSRRHRRLSAAAR